MPEFTIRPSRIVAAVDGSDYASGVVGSALDLAARSGAAELHFLRVVSAPGHAARDLDQEPAIAAAHKELSEVVHEALVTLGQGADRSRWSVRVHAIAGSPVEEVLSLAADLAADTIVIGRWGTQRPSRARLGSIAAGIVAGASCPVLVHQPTDYGTDVQRRGCDDCVAARRESHGEIWFCPAHRSQHAFRSTSVIASAFIPTGSAT